MKKSGQWELLQRLKTVHGEDGDRSRESPHMRNGRDATSLHAQPTYLDRSSPEYKQDSRYTVTHSLRGTNTSPAKATSSF